MNPVDVLAQAARGFVARYEADERLRAEQADWDCRLRLEANDAAHRIDIVIAGGEVRAIGGAGDPIDLVVNAPLTTLVDILQGRLNPNQPYLFGELTLQGEEADFMRVDYIVGTLGART